MLACEGSPHPEELCTHPRWSISSQRLRLPLNPPLVPLPQIPAQPGQSKWEPSNGGGGGKDHGSPSWVVSLYEGLRPQQAQLDAHIKHVHLMEAQGQKKSGGGGFSEKQTCDPYSPLDPPFLSETPHLFPMFCVPAPRPFPIFLCVCLCPSISHFFCPSVFRCPTPLDPIRIPQAAKLPMSIIIIGVGQAEFDGECSSPRCFPAGSRPLGTALAFPQRESCWLGVAIWVWVCLFAQGRVCHGVHLRPRPRAVGRRAGHSCLLQPRGW